MVEKHIVSGFDKDLESIEALIMKMGGLVEASIADATRSFETRDNPLAEEVIARDKMIDQLEASINAQAARVLALRSPNAVDLRLILSVIKVSGNLERIGDYSKNMAKRTGVLLELPEIENAGSSLRRLGREVELMLKDALDAYIQRDPNLAEQVILKDRDVDQLYNGMFRQFLTFMMEDPRSISRVLNMLWALRALERIGDHAKNVAEHVIYLVKGMDVRHEKLADVEEQLED